MIGFWNEWPSPYRGTAIALLAGDPVSWDMELAVDEYARSQGQLEEWYVVLREARSGFLSEYDAQQLAVEQYKEKPGTWKTEAELREWASVGGAVRDTLGDVKRTISNFGGSISTGLKRIGAGAVVIGAVIAAIMLWRRR